MLRRVVGEPTLTVGDICKLQRPGRGRARLGTKGSKGGNELDSTRPHLELACNRPTAERFPHTLSLPLPLFPPLPDNTAPPYPLPPFLLPILTHTRTNSLSISPSNSLSLSLSEARPSPAVGQRLNVSQRHPLNLAFSLLPLSTHLCLSLCISLSLSPSLPLPISDAGLSTAVGQRLNVSQWHSLYLCLSLALSPPLCPFLSLALSLPTALSRMQGSRLRWDNG